MAKELTTMGKELALVKNQYEKVIQQNDNLQKHFKLLNEMLNIVINKLTNK